MGVADALQIDSGGNGLRTTRAMPRPSPNLRVLTFAVVLAGLGASLLVLVRPDTGRPFDPLAATLIAVGFLVTESVALHVEIRKESHSLSMSSVPLLIGLVVVTPAALAVAYVVGGVTALAIVRRSGVVKTSWNASLFVAQAGIAGAILTVLIGGRAPADALDWGAVLLAAMAAEFASLIAVPVVIMLVDTTFRPHLFADLGRSQVLAALATCYAAVALRCAMDDPAMAVFAAAPLVGLAVTMRGAGELRQRHRDLQQLHTFTSMLTAERGSRTIDTGLRELVDIMRADASGLVSVGDDPADTRIRRFGDGGFEEIPDGPLANALADLVGSADITILSAADRRPQVRSVLERLDTNLLLAAPALAEAERRGIVFVTERRGMRDEYTETELRLFGSLAKTFSSRLSNDLLVDRLRSQARHDALTGLPNRMSFEAELDIALCNATSTGTVVMIDLDRFKEINDSLGHATGDQLLTVIAERLRTAVGDAGMVARFGGDEFALLLTDGAGSPDRLARIQLAATSTVSLGNISFETGASFGAAHWPEHGSDTTTLLRRADVAMYEAKRRKHGVVHYHEGLDADSPRRTDLYLSAADAFERAEFYTVFQPKVSISTGRVTGAEALARWRHPVHGEIPPDEFVPLLEQAGLSASLSRFVIAQATIAVNRLLRSGHRVPIAVNLSPRDLLDPSLPTDVERLLRTTDVPADLLCIEITEDSMVVDFDTSARTLEALRDLGVGIAIDDFGTGYASLQHLHRLPVDELKIDHTFISRMATDASAAAIVRASINLANELGLDSVAEGVEDGLTVRALSALGCTEVQGYLISKPRRLDDIAEWVTTWCGDPLLSWLLTVGDRSVDELHRTAGTSADVS